MYGKFGEQMYWSLLKVNVAVSSKKVYVLKKASDKILYVYAAIEYRLLLTFP